MNTLKWIGLIIVLVLIFVVIYVTRCQKQCTEPITHNVAVEFSEDENLWRVRDSNGYNRGILVVNRNDQINWQVRGSDVVFGFPVNLNEFAEFNDSLFNVNMREMGQPYESRLSLDALFMDKIRQPVEDGGSLNLNIRANAPAGTIEYEVYVVSDDTLVVGDSPPILIIR